MPISASHLSSSATSLLRREMPTPSSRVFSSSLLIIILYTAVQTYSQDNNPFVTDCHGDNFSASGPYASNLHLLIGKLIATTPKSPTFFSLDNSTSPQIFGLAQCRPDRTAAVCADCLNRTAAAFFNNQGCGLSKSFANRAENCLFRYSDQMFYNVLEEGMFVYNSHVQSAPDSFNSRVKILMNSVMASAASALLKFAVGTANDSADGQDIYGMGWCTMDLTSSDCAQCLSMVFGRIPAGMYWGEGATVSCLLRFETFQFYSSPPTPPPLPQGGGKRSINKTIAIVAGTSGAVALLLFFTLFILLLQRRKRKSPTSNTRNIVGEEVLKNLEIKMIDFCAIKNATNNFANENKLGQGGFGPVYKGVLINGQEVAVKRLSATSGQGLAEMKNEIKCTAKLQHKNLVRLLGYCLQQEEKLLVYEFLPNTSLDKFLFDPTRKIQLDWATRIMIIVGISRGLLYLHEDSCLKIVHRDLKASNILLDSNMNPKISDFGLAKLFGIDETERNTCRINGTFGYMAPEYVLHGLFSTKSDVFSYGVLVLEIITGKKCIDESEQADDLLNYVWKHWKQRKALEVIDKSIGERYTAQQALRYIQIGLLCVQEEQTQRPKMAFVNAMLCTPSKKLPNPSAPLLYNNKSFSVDLQAVASGRNPELP